MLQPGLCLAAFRDFFLRTSFFRRFLVLTSFSWCNQGDKPRNEIQQLEKYMRDAIPIWCFQFMPDFSFKQQIRVMAPDWAV